MQIAKLRLFSKQLERQKAFYTARLGFELTAETADSFTVKTGTTELCFVQSESAYYYHFAFNIPSFQMLDGYAWLQAKAVACIPYQGNDIVDFKNWNAEAVYFYDEDGNLGELIARKNMAIEKETPFSAQSILSISEIGLAVMEVKKQYDLFKSYGLQQYSGDQDYFCAMGDEEGLFIIVDQQRKQWMPTVLPAIPAPFFIQIMQTNKAYSFHYNGRLIEEVESFLRQP